MSLANLADRTSHLKPRKAIMLVFHVTAKAQLAQFVCWFDNNTFLCPVPLQFLSFGDSPQPAMA